MDSVLVEGGRAGTHVGKPIYFPGTLAFPFKYHAEHRHRIPEARYRVTNWAEYDASLRRRGSLTVWFTDEAIQAWRAQPRTTPGGQSHYSALAISTALTMGMVFGLALRQTEGLIGSVIGLLGLDLATPDHSTLSRRAKTLELPQLRRAGAGPLHLLVDSTGLKLGGAGEWLIEKHGTTRRRSSCFFHRRRRLRSGSGDRGCCQPSSGRCCRRATTGGRDSECFRRNRSDTARPASADDRRSRPDGLAKGQRLQSAGQGRGVDRAVQTCDRQCPSISHRPNRGDRGCPCCRCPEPDAGVWTPGLCPYHLNTG